MAFIKSSGSGSSFVRHGLRWQSSSVKGSFIVVGNDFDMAAIETIIELAAAIIIIIDITTISIVFELIIAPSDFATINN